ncbi:hypothetical protein XCR_1531 [Xanthomonas campestris pv. raphani 756C]|nr:hypothetical protein XCR_1531 [Xanthomonas campestris pv. raphani 756C]
MATSCGQKGCVLSQMRLPPVAIRVRAIVAPRKPVHTSEARATRSTRHADKEAA